jgi:hypothetical protein
MSPRQFFITLSLVAVALAGQKFAANTTCPPVHLLLARGTTESYPGLLGSLSSLVLGSINGSTYEDILYPATQEGSTLSYEEGIANATVQLKTFVAACPKSKIALLGYSQVCVYTSEGQPHKCK